LRRFFKRLRTLCSATGIEATLLGGDDGTWFEGARVLDHLRDIRETLSALRAPSATAEDIGDRFRIPARRFRKLPVSQRIADTNKHSPPLVPAFGQPQSLTGPP
jgi:hypothetical protein